MDDLPLRRLEEGQSCYGRGMWAPSLRWHDGRFWLCFTSADTHETWLYHTERIEGGVWEKQTIQGYYHDPSLFFDDDGRAYLVWGNTELHLAELNAELTGLRPGGLNRVIARGDFSPFLGYEGAHLEKVNGRYYLFTIHSLADCWRRVQTCLAADSLTGEFTGGIVLNDDLGWHGQGVAQGGIVDTPDGRWFAVLFQDRGALGRTPVLVPVTWEKGMPRLGVAGRVPAEAVNLSTRPGYRYAPLTEGDDFTSPELKAMWEWNHVPEAACWSTGDGALTLTAPAAAKELTQVRNMLTVRATGPVTEVTVRVDGAALSPGDRAGLCALQADWISAFLCREEDGFSVGWQERGREAVMAFPCGAEITLRLRLDFTDMRDTVTCYALGEEGWVQLNAAPHHVTFDLSHFVGVRPGLFCQATRTPGGSARFSAFTYNAE